VAYVKIAHFGLFLSEVATLTGSLTKTIIPKKVEISYNDLINKLAEITDAQVDSGVGTDEVLMTPTKAGKHRLQS
jgi:hypothetical protein